MRSVKINNNCQRIRTWLYKVINNRVGVGAGWVQNHIAGCPRCQQRLASVGKVALAISIIKSQPYKLDLWMRANTKAIGVLKHSLRNCPRAEKLKAVLPEPKMFEKCFRYKNSIANTAACIAILVLMKVGIFSSMNKFQSESEKMVRHYYASQAGEDLADKIFSA